MKNAGRISEFGTAPPPCLHLRTLCGGLKSPVAQPTLQAYHIRIASGRPQVLRGSLESSPDDSSTQSPRDLGRIWILIQQVRSGTTFLTSPQVTLLVHGPHFEHHRVRAGVLKPGCTSASWKPEKGRWLALSQKCLVALGRGASIPHPPSETSGQQVACRPDTPGVFFCASLSPAPPRPHSSPMSSPPPFLTDVLLRGEAASNVVSATGKASRLPDLSLGAPGSAIRDSSLRVEHRSRLGGLLKIQHS